MAGRALAFSDAAIIKMATKDYVPVAADDWYQRRRRDAEGKFFRRVADQGPRKGAGGSTRQGIYMFTADGKLLAFKNAQGADVMRGVLKQGLRAWANLPAARRQPGAVKVPDHGKLDAHYSRVPPPGGLVVKTWTRILEQSKDGLKHGTCDTRGGEKAARDHLWITADEVQALFPADPVKGAKSKLPATLAERVLRFHLTDSTRGEPPFWTREQIRKQDLSLLVEEVAPASLTLRLEGTALLATSADPARAERGFDVRLLGRIRFDRAKKTVTAFDVVAVGDHWGDGTYTRGSRPGKQPLGVAFELARRDDPALVPPQASREIGEYIRRRR